MGAMDARNMYSNLADTLAKVQTAFLTKCSMFTRLTYERQHWLEGSKGCNGEMNSAWKIYDCKTYSHQQVWTGSGAHPAVSPIGIWDLQLGLKVPQHDTDHTPSLSKQDEGKLGQGSQNMLPARWMRPTRSLYASLKVTLIVCGLGHCFLFFLIYKWNLFFHEAYRFKSFAVPVW